MSGSDLLILGADDVRRVLDVLELIDALEPAFVELSAGRATAPPRTAAVGRDGILGVMPGFLPGTGLVTKLVSVFPGNHDRGLPSHQALIAVFDEATGAPRAVIDGTVITALRTAAAAALSARLLRRQKAAVLTILGAGVQGRAHLDALTAVFEPMEIRIASRNRDHARDLAGQHDWATAVDGFEEAVRGADVICCCTDSPTPVIDHSWLRPGAHVTSVGTSRGGPEVDAATVAAATLFVESRVAFQPYPAGSHELAGVDPARAAELGEVLAGSRAGRSSEDEVTLYKSMGHAVEDAAAAALVMRRAAAGALGSTIRL